MVDNISATLTEIQQAGGNVLTPRREIGPKMGAFAVFADPAGNEFGLYEEPQQ
jgi:predicted enzyme related to lactoylglutathione lyase